MDDRPGTNDAEDNLDAYSRRLEEKLRSMRLNSDYPGRSADLPDGMRARQRILQERVTEAIRSGRFWEIVKAEFVRDYGSLFDGLLRTEQLVDGVFTAHTQPVRAHANDSGRAGDPDDAA